MISLVIVFCGMSSTVAPDCYKRTPLTFPSKQSCEAFLMNNTDKKRWGEGFVVAFCGDDGREK